MPSRPGRPNSTLSIAAALASFTLALRADNKPGSTEPGHPDG